MEGGKTEAFSKGRKSLPKSTVEAESNVMKITVTSQKISKIIESLIHELENIIYTCVCTTYKKSLTIQGDLPMYCLDGPEYSRLEINEKHRALEHDVKIRTNSITRS